MAAETSAGFSVGGVAAFRQRDAVLLAVNLGDDADTTGAIYGHFRNKAELLAESKNQVRRQPKREMLSTPEGKLQLLREEVKLRESQIAQFVYLGQFGDTCGPGKHTLSTDNIPILSTLKGWKYGFESPFKADIYFVNTRLFTGNKWGTSNPVMMRDADFGVVRLRAFGTYALRAADPRALMTGLVGTDIAEVVVLDLNAAPSVAVPL